LLRSECLTLRYKFEPASAKFVVVTAWPPKPRLYFYDPSGSIKEPLFKAIMKILSYNPATKEAGLREFQRRGCLLVDATYRSLDGLSEGMRQREILKSYPALLAELSKVLPDKSTPITVVRTRFRQALERMLRNDRFTVLNNSDFAARCRRARYVPRRLSEIDPATGELIAIIPAK
jgi:hypothetical protein